MHTLFERILLLKSAPVFREVATDDLASVARLLAEERFGAGERVFERGDRGDQMYILVSGRVGISVHADPARRAFVNELGAGDCFGEMGVLDNAPRSATVHVLEEAAALTLDGGRLRQLLLRHPEIALGIIASLSARLRAIA